jgi:hypothetical protein
MIYIIKSLDGTFLKAFAHKTAAMKFCSKHLSTCISEMLIDYSN